MPRNVEDEIQLNINFADLPDNKEDFQLIWLDASLGESSDVLATQEMLRKLNTNAQFYTDVEKCLQLIQNIKTEHIILIVSGQLAYQILPQVNNLRSVRAVFIFCETRELHTALLTENSYKIIDICTDRDALLKSISETMKLIEKQDDVFHLFDSTQKSTRDLSKESASFLWHRLLLDVLRKLPADEQAKNEMLDYCAAYYRHNREELKKIERFRTSYIPDDAIKYYTEDSFLYRLLNKALRTEDIGLLYIFRFFIIDLCAQLEDGKKLLVETAALTVYRGQQVPKEEFEHLKTKIGSLIATNGFLSTSREERVSLGFSHSSLLREDMSQVSLTIKADPKLRTVTFADVSRQSEFEFEREVLFSLGAVFRIDACDFDETLSLGKLTLTATDEGSEILREFLNAQKSQLQVYPPMIYFGRLLMIEMNEIDRAETYFHALLETLPEDHPDIADVYNQIGVTQYMQQNKDEALKMFEKALEIRQNTFGENDIHIAYSMNNIGSVYNDWGEYDRALDCYQRALHIIDSAKLGDSRFKASVIQNCGILKQRSGDQEAALSFYTEADEMYSRYLPIYHPTFVESASKLARLYEEKSDSINALKYYKRMYESCEVMLQPTESKFKEAYADVVRCCLKLGDKKLAITYLDQVLNICGKLSLNAKETSTYYVLSMAKLSGEELHFEMALNYYKEYLRLNAEKTCIPDFEYLSDDFSEKSPEERIRILSFKMEAYEKLFTSNDLAHSTFLANMGELLEELDAIDSAYRCYQKAFDILEALSLNNEDVFWKLWHKLVNISFEKKDDQLVLDYLKRALRKCQEDLSDNVRSHIGFLSHIANKYEDIGDVSNALQYFEEAFASAESIKSYQDIHFLLDKIFKICVANGHEQVIHTYIQRAVHIYEKDPVSLSRWYRTLGDLYWEKDKTDEALHYYKQFLLITELKESFSSKELDEMWTGFVVEIIEDMNNPVKTLSKLLQIQELCDRYLLPSHFKTATVSWTVGYWHEQKRIYKVALKKYQDAIKMWEKLVYNCDDKRTKNNLSFLISHYTTVFYFGYSINWLKGPAYSKFAFTIMFGSARMTWKCIFQRLKILKMIYMNNLWNFHRELRAYVIDSKLCSMIVQPMLKVCADQLYCVEHNISSDIHKVICCLEFISHWYFAKEQYLESLLHRQHQLELETKLFSSSHSHVGGSLWFIGLIFQKMNDHHVALDYFTRALKIFQHLFPKGHRDIEQLEKHISLANQTIDEEVTLQMAKSGDILEQKTETKQIKLNTHQSVPRSLQATFHLD